MSLVDFIYEGLEDEAAFSRLPARIAQSAGARSTTFQIFPDIGPPEMLYSHFSPEMIAYYLEQNLMPHDVWHAMGMRQGRFETVFRADDRFPPDQFARTVMYNECFRRFGDDTGRCMGALIPTSQGVISLGVHRAIDAPGLASPIWVMRPTAGQAVRITRRANPRRN